MFLYGLNHSYFKSHTWYSSAQLLSLTLLENIDHSFNYLVLWYFNEYIFISLMLVPKVISKPKCKDILLCVTQISTPFLRTIEVLRVQLHHCIKHSLTELFEAMLLSTCCVLPMCTALIKHSSMLVTCYGRYGY
jgi:hypothetical protein